MEYKTYLQSAYFGVIDIEHLVVFAPIFVEKIRQIAPDAYRQEGCEIIIPHIGAAIGPSAWYYIWHGTYGIINCSRQYALDKLDNLIEIKQAVLRFLPQPIAEELLPEMQLIHELLLAFMR